MSRRRSGASTATPGKDTNAASIGANAEAGPSTPATPVVLRRSGGQATPAAAAPTTPATASPAKGRALRARASGGPPPKKPRTTGTRIITPEEEARAIWKLSAEGTATRRDEMIRDLETRVRAVVEKHDMAVREKFHLERYVSILEGWNPEEAKVDNSPVFLEYKNTHHDLLSFVPSAFIPLPEAGPSRRPVGPTRTTRRQLHQKSEALGHVTAIAKKGKDNEAEKEEVAAQDKGKGKAKAESQPEAEVAKARTVTPEPTSRSRKGKGKAEMPPPPVPSRKSRRATTHGAAAPEPEPEPEEEAPAPSAKGKKRGRQSMPSLPAKKRALEASRTASPASSPAPTLTPSPPSPTPEPAAPLPSLAHLPFPPPPARPPLRRSYLKLRYTDPNQRPPPPKFGGDAGAYLESYLHIEDTGPPADLASLEARAAREGYIRNRVNWLQHQGRLMRLLDEDDEGPADKAARDRRHERKVPTGPPPRQTDFQDSLMAHMVQVRNAMVGEAKIKPVVCKKIARMIQVYWEHIATKDERARIAEERERKRKAKEVVKALKKRWGLAIKIIRAKVREAQKLEQDRLGKEHLQNMLQRSTGLLEGQRDVIVGREEDDDEDEGERSDATADVSAAEDSEDEGDEGDEEAAEEAEGGDGIGEEAEEGQQDAEVDTAMEEAGEEVGDEEDAEEEDDEDDEDDDEDDSASESETEEMPKVDYHAMLGIKQEEALPLPEAEGLATEEEPVESEAASRLETEAPEEPAPAAPAPEVAASEPAPEEPTPQAAAEDVPLTEPEPSQVEIATAPQADVPVKVEPIPVEAAPPVARTPFDDMDVEVPFAEVRYDDITMDEIDASFGPTPVDTTPVGPTPAAEPVPEPEVLPAEVEAEPVEVTPEQPSAPEPAAPTSPERPPSPAAKPPPTPTSSPPPPPRAPSRRLRAKARAQKRALASPDPDANDTEFQAVDTTDADAKLDDEMEDTKADGGDSEDEGLLADAEMPIEELLKRYGYPMPGAEEVEEEKADVDDKQAREEREATHAEDAEDEEMADVSMAIVADAPSSDPAEHAEPAVADAPRANGTAEAAAEAPVAAVAAPVTETRATDATAATQVTADQSLTDEALAQRQHSPALIIEGKRQRKVRRVWTPPDTPQHAVGKPRKPKVEDVEAEPEPEPEPSPTPESSSEEESEEDDEEMDEDEAEGADEPAEDSSAPRVRPPFLLRGTLRPYQQAGLEWLASLYANNMNGILADEMGLGKTIQTISLLGHLACDKGVWGPHLIIVPTSVILNWEMEFKKFLPGMKVLTYYGNQKERKEKRVGWNTENAWQVCITSYQIVLADQHIFRRKNWVYMILDEAHNIKNFRSQRWQTLLGFKTQRRLLLTGTPLQNNLMELWSLLYFLMPNGITADATAVVGFANHRDFMEWFSNPMDKAVESGDTLDEETIETVSKLHTLLRPFILRRLKADVETQLPGKFEHVVYCRLSKRQRFLYDEFMSRASTREALTNGGYLGVMNTLMQLRKVCNHPDLFEVRPVRTSFAMERGVLSDFEPIDILVRKRLLAQQDELDLEALGFLITGREDESAWVSRARKQLDASDRLPYALEPVRKLRGPKSDLRTIDGWAKYRAFKDHQAEIARWHALRDVNRRRCTGGPIFGRTVLEMFDDLPRYLLPESVQTRRKMDWFAEHLPPASALVQTLAERLNSVSAIVDRFAVIPPNAVVRDVASFALPGLNALDPTLRDPAFDTLHPLTVKLQIAFPDVSLLQYDCGKLQKLAEMLRDLKADGHRVLIFTQMTRVLDILEIFLSYNGHRYLRLDGSTKIEDRQVLTERFNSDPRIFCLIASSRSGGVGINLTGADTVFFYDSDWNPSMDRQCMDRAHRIGQTREVHIYRFVSSHTVEENMLKKANQKRLLDRVVIQEGDFTTDFFGKMDWRDMLDESDLQPADEERIEDVDKFDAEEEGPQVDVIAAAPGLGKEREFALALAQVEDEEDAAAARVAQGEGELDFADFGDEGKKAKKDKTVTLEDKAPANPAISRLAAGTPSMSATATPGTGTGTQTPHSDSATPAPDHEDYGYEDGYDDDEPGAIDEYMLRYVEWEWETYFCNIR